MTSESDKQALVIPDDILARWQSIVDLIAHLLHVPAALIMRVDEPYIEVFLASRSAPNPYHVGDREKLTGLYCERVIDSQEKLLVPDALADEDWKHNPDIELGMISYLGFPLLWPDDTPFGTICVLDSTENAYNAQYEKLLVEFKHTIETHLQLIFQNNVLERMLAEHEKAQEERIQLAAEQQRVQVLHKFIADASHDLLTPISIIRSSLYLAQRVPDEHKRRIQIDKIEDQVMLLQKMIEDMLFMSRLDTINAEDLEHSPVNMNQLVQRLADNQRPKANEKHQQFTLELPSQPIYLSIDNDYLSTALASLLDNAIRYTDDGGTITVTLTNEENQAVIIVQDTGCGIAEDDFPFIFDRFYRAQAHRPSGEGSGLGLSIAYRIIDLHGGQVELESTPGEGSIFRVRLPIQSNIIPNA